MAVSGNYCKLHCLRCGNDSNVNLHTYNWYTSTVLHLTWEIPMKIRDYILKTVEWAPWFAASCVPGQTTGFPASSLSMEPAFSPQDCLVLVTIAQWHQSLREKGRAWRQNKASPHAYCAPLAQSKFFKQLFSWQLGQWRTNVCALTLSFYRLRKQT